MNEHEKERFLFKNKKVINDLVGMEKNEEFVYEILNRLEDSYEKSQLEVLFLESGRVFVTYFEIPIIVFSSSGDFIVNGDLIKWEVNWTCLMNKKERKVVSNG
ncbi:hypothetical protein [Virgibacillus sp. DJP39]|uniref:hypothetical protein n=1 Tax=Virgibacillus sp. DJP39 TaxID=3409790 RepID=UPI003BB7994E